MMRDVTGAKLLVGDAIVYHADGQLRFGRIFEIKTKLSGFWAENVCMVTGVRWGYTQSLRAPSPSDPLGLQSKDEPPGGVVLPETSEPTYHLNKARGRLVHGDLILRISPRDLPPAAHALLFPLPGTVEELVAEQQTLQARLVQIDGELERARADTSRLVRQQTTEPAL